MDNPQAGSDLFKTEEPKPRDLFSLKLGKEFKAALNQEAQKERRSLTNWIVTVLVAKIGWKGKV